MKNFVFVGLIILTAAFGSCKKSVSPTPITTTTSVDSLKIGLIAYYPFNDSAIDSSGNGNTALIYSLTSFADRFGKAGNAYLFNGSTSYASVTDNAALRLNNTDFTVNTWVNLNAYNSTAGSFIFSKRTSGLNDGWGFSITGYQSGIGTGIGQVYFGPGGGNAYAVSVKSITTGKWYMVTAVYSFAKQQVSFYINGVFDSSTNNIPTPNPAITANLYIGTDNPANYTSYFINGALNDMRIYGRALNAGQVQKLYLSVD